MDDAKVACASNPACMGIACSRGRTTGCSLRVGQPNVPYAYEDCYTWEAVAAESSS